jgi:DNA primase
MFPICDEQGRVVGFSGRILSGDEKTAKYVNSPETPIFTKSKIFFGLDKSKRALLDSQFAVVCEGQLDLIACFMAGVQNVVAPQGTAFTADHARILRRYVEEVVLCFDSDAAGQNAAVRALDSLLASGLAVRVATLPPAHDPDTFVKEFGDAALKQLIEQAEGFFDYYLNRLCATNDVASDKGRLAVLRGMGEAVHKTANGVLIDKYAQKTALRLGVSPDAVRAEFRKLSRPKSHPRKTSDEEVGEEPAAQPSVPMPATELWLLKIMLTHEDLVAWIAQRIDLAWLQHPAARRIVEARISAQKDGSWSGVAGFLDRFEDEESRNILTEAVTDPRKIMDPEKTLKGDPGHGDKRGILERLRDEFLDQELAARQQRANNPETSDSERLELLKQQQELRFLKRKPIALA